MNKIYYSNELYHHGIKGQKWGIRRFQNEDGSYKPGAEGRYYDPVGGIRKVVRKVTGDREAKKAAKVKYKAAVDKAYDKEEKAVAKIESKYKPGEELLDEDLAKQDKVFKDYHSDLANAKKIYKEEMAKAGGLSDKQKIALTVGAAVAVAGLAAFATYKISQKNSSAIKEAFDRTREKGENYLNRLEVEYLSDHSYRDNKYFYRKFENPYTSSLKELTDKYDKNLFNRLTRRDSTDLAGYSALREINGHYDEIKDRVVSETKSMMNGTVHTFNGGDRRGLYNNSSYTEYLARKRK